MARKAVLLAALLFLPTAAWAQARKLLYVTFSGGFVHGSVAVSEQVLREIGQRSGAFEVTVTQDPAQINAANLRNFDAVFFFTTGELPLSEAQKQALLDFVRNGKGFGGAHSATDTFYTWPEYGELIGAYFDGHPWTQVVAIQVEDPEHPAVSHLAPSFQINEEIYQFGNPFSRTRVRVLMTLDTRSVDMNAEGIHRTDGDFALAWVRSFGSGRSFYTALGHFDETWRDPRFQEQLLNGIRWMMGDLAGSAEPRPKPGTAAPRISAGGAVNAASFSLAPAGAVAPGSIISIFGTSLTAGDTAQATSIPLPTTLAGTTVAVNGRAAPLFFASPLQINAQFPVEVGAGPATVVVTTAAGASPAETVPVAPVAAGVFALDGTGRGAALALHTDGRLVTAEQPARRGEALMLYATGLGATTPQLASGTAAGASPLVTTVSTPVITVGGVRAEVLFSGLAPNFVGLNQVNIRIPSDAPTGNAVELLVGQSNRTTLAIVP